MLNPSNPQIFDPIKREAAIAWARTELTKAELQVEILEEVKKRTGISVDLSDCRHLVETIQRMIADLEAPFVQVH